MSVSTTCVLIVLILGMCQSGSAIQRRGKPKVTGQPCFHLDKAREYESKGDLLAEQEFRFAIVGGAKGCPEALLEFSRHLSGRLLFDKSAASLKSYIRHTPNKAHQEDIEELYDLKRAARLKKQVDASSEPSLKDLLDLTHLVTGYGRKHQSDALVYAEKAVTLYPDSVSAILLLVKSLPYGQIQTDRKVSLLNQAAIIEPNNSLVFSTRGWVYFYVRDLRNAEKDFRRALSSSQNTDSGAWKGLGYALMERGSKRDAISAFRNYLRYHKASTHDDDEITILIESLERNPH